MEQVHGPLRLGRGLAVQQPVRGLWRDWREKAGRDGVPFCAEPGSQPGASIRRTLTYAIPVRVTLRGSASVSQLSEQATGT